MRKGAVLPLAALLGAAVVILPAVASSETTGTIEATEKKVIYAERRWTPSETSVSAGNSLTFKNPSTETSHGVEWRSPPATPNCTGVPVGNAPAASGTNWSGTCTFAQPGTYEFWCTVHKSEMRGVITVNADGTTTTTTTATPPPGSTSGVGQGSPGSSSGGGAPGSPLAGSAASAVKLASSQHGSSVRGSVEVSAAGAGGSLSVEVFAKSAALASADHGTRVRVGRIVLSHLRSGKASFSVPLNRRARGALRRHHRLAVTARLQIQAAGDPPLTITRSVTLHR
jgi:plastocyanin